MKQFKSIDSFNEIKIHGTIHGTIHETEVNCFMNENSERNALLGLVKQSHDASRRPVRGNLSILRPE